MLRWYERKSQHRSQMLQYAGDLDIMSTYNLQQYLLECIIPSIGRLNKVCHMFSNYIFIFRTFGKRLSALYVQKVL